MEFCTVAIGDLYNVTCEYHTPGGTVTISQAYEMTDGTMASDTLQNLAVFWGTNLANLLQVFLC
ncbi:unnamed protein product, partial [marine sediment metagenome]